jgi:hypothetical protein
MKSHQNFIIQNRYILSFAIKVYTQNRYIPSSTTKVDSQFRLSIEVQGTVGKTRCDVNHN